MIKLTAKTAPVLKVAFYLNQADECGKAAASATLENVRERSLRSEAAWRKMADDIGGAPDAPPAETAEGPEVASLAISKSTPAFASFG